MAEECGECLSSEETRDARILGLTRNGRSIDKQVECAVVGDRLVFEGDIVVGPAGNVDAPDEGVQRGVVIVGERYRWPDNTVFYAISEGLPNPKRVHDAVAHWVEATTLRFVERANENDGYILFVQSDGCWSYVGRQGGMQRIGLARGCSTGNTIHEIGHAIGMWHEQSREDRDRFVKIAWANIEAKHRHNFSQHVVDGEDVGKYDFRSIMHYGARAFSMNGLPTIETLNGEAIGQRNELSASDIATVRKMYPEPSRA